MNSTDLQVRFFHKYLKPIRICAGMTQDDLANELGITKHSLYPIERQNAKLTVERYYACRYIIDQKKDDFVNKVIRFFALDENVSNDSKDSLAYYIVSNYNMRQSNCKHGGVEDYVEKYIEKGMNDANKC